MHFFPELFESNVLSATKNRVNIPTNPLTFNHVANVKLTPVCVTCKHS